MAKDWPYLNKTANLWLNALLNFNCSISTWCKTCISRFCATWLVDHCQDQCNHLTLLSSVGMWASRHIRLTVLLTSYGVRVVGIAFDLVNEKIYIVDFLVCSIWLRRGLTPHFHTIFWLSIKDKNGMEQLKDYIVSF